MLWVASLGFSAIVLVGNSDSISGLHVLLTGWLGPFALNFAWYANPFFFLVIYRLTTAEDAHESIAWASLLLAADSFALAGLPAASIESNSEVYGFGLGALLWFCAIVLAGLAMGLRSMDFDLREVDSTELPVGHTSTLVHGALLIALLVVFAFFAIQDRRHAVGADREPLSNAAFKLGRVCTQETFKADRRYVLNGALEIDVERPDNVGSPINPETIVTSPLELLRAGFPVVTRENLDFFLSNPANRDSLAIQHTTRNTGARLSIQEGVRNASLAPKYIRARLESKAGEVLFEHEWYRAGPRSAFMCPLSGVDKANQELQALLLGTLVDGSGQRFKSVPNTPTESLRQVVMLPRSEVRTIGSIKVRSRPENEGCPEGVGVTYDRLPGNAQRSHRLEEVTRMTGFTVNAVARKMSVPLTSSACSQAALYLFGARPDHEQWALFIQRWSFAALPSDLPEVSMLTIPMQTVGKEPGQDRALILGVAEHGGRATLRIGLPEGPEGAVSIVEVDVVNELKIEPR